MAVISTIKPDGTGDFTTLALWEDWADGDPSGTSNAAYWAECYKGGNLGTVNVTGWSVSATADSHPKIYAAAGQGHGGDVTDGAYIQTGSVHGIQSSGGIAGLHVDGIRIDGTAITHKVIDMASGTTVGILYQTVENCYIHSTDAGFQVGIFCGNLLQDNGAVTKNVVIRNNIIEQEYGDGDILKAYAIAIGAAALGGSSAAVTNGWIHNNTIVSRSGDTDNEAKGLGWYTSGGKILNLYVENNYFSMEDTSAPRLIFIAALNIGGTSNLTIRNNGQPDAGDITTGGFNDDSNYPGHATVINAAASDQFTDRANGDYSLKATSVLKDAGKVPAAYGLSYISVASEDVLGNSRPQSTAWDIGAYEYLVPVVYPTTRYTELDITGDDVIAEIIQANPRQQGRITVNNGGIVPVTLNKNSHHNRNYIVAENYITTMNSRLVKPQEIQGLNG